jgi:ribosome-associated protein
VRESHTRALLAARAALEKHAEGVVVMDVRTLSSVTDFFVICTADSPRQLNAIKDHVEAKLAEAGSAVWHVEGATSPRTPARTAAHEPQWMLMDCGEIVVHLLDQRTRSFYRLEDLWADAPRVPIESFDRLRTQH